MKWAGGDPATAFAEHENKRKGESIFSIIRDMDRLTTDIDMFNHTMTFVFQEKDREAVLRLASSLPETWLVKEKDEESDEEYEHEVSVDRSLHEREGGHVLACRSRNDGRHGDHALPGIRNRRVGSGSSRLPPSMRN